MNVNKNKLLKNDVKTSKRHHDVIHECHLKMPVQDNIFLHWLVSRKFLSGMQEYIFWYFGMNELIPRYSEYTVVLKDLPWA